MLSYTQDHTQGMSEKTYHLPLSIIKQLYVERTSTREALGSQYFGHVYP